MTREFKTGLEFLNEGPRADRAKEVRELCLQIADETSSDLSVDSLAYLLMEMYNRGLNEGAIAALIYSEHPKEIH